MNTTITSESIEACPKEDIPNLKSTAFILHEETPKVLETPMSAQDAEREEQLRSSLVLKLSETINWIEQQIVDLDALKRDLRIVKSYQTSDKKRIESKKIGIYVLEKTLRQHP